MVTVYGLVSDVMNDGASQAYSRVIGARYPNLFLVGAPKCGTTSLSRYLSGHPEIFMSEQAGWKEPGYYAEDDKDLFGMRPVKNLEDYLHIFEQAPSSVRWMGDASITYLASKVAIPRILADRSDARFIVTIRNPIAIARGMHNQRVKEGSENIIDFERAWRAQDARMHRRMLPNGDVVNPLAFQYGNLARIGTQVTRLLELVPRSQIHFIVHDDLINETAAIYRQIINFLGLEDDGRKNFDILNVSKSVRNPVFARSMFFLNSMRKSLRIPSLGLGLYQKIYSFGLTEGKGELRPEFKRELNHFYREEVAKLSSVLRRDLSSWLT